MRTRSRLFSQITVPARRISGRLRNRLASEAGFAVPTVLLMTVAALGMAGVAVTTSIGGQQGVVRDQGSKSALAVAESGVNQALLHYNRGVAPCEPGAEGEWCGPVTGMSVNDGTVSYWARLADNAEECGVVDVGQCVEIVSTGTVGGVTRRVNVFALSGEPPSSSANGPFASASVLSKETMTLNSNAVIHTGMATDGGFELNSNARQCGPASIGIGEEMITNSNSRWYGNAACTGAKLDPGSAPEAELNLPPVEQPEDLETENDNGRFFDEDVITTPLEADKICWNGINGEGEESSDCGERELALNSNSALTLGGSVYSFCKLTLKSNSILEVAGGADVTIFFDSPENCDYDPGVQQLLLDSNTRITSAEGDPTSVKMLFVGSESIPTEIVLNSNTQVDGPCDQNFVVYAPLTDVELKSNSRFCGAIAGKSVHLDSNAEIWAASGTEDFELPDAGSSTAVAHYEPIRFVECTGVAAEPPDTGC